LGNRPTAPPPLMPKPVVWIASSKDDISALPDPVKASFAHRLREVHEGRKPRDTIATRNLTQKEAAGLCGTDQPTLSKVLRGRMESVTIDRLAAWLNALGRKVEIHVRPYDLKSKAGQLVIAP
jgi:hypothetical protein